MIGCDLSRYLVLRSYLDSPLCRLLRGYEYRVPDCVVRGVVLQDALRSKVMV